MALCLEGYVALAEHLLGSGGHQFLGVGVAFIELRLGVFEHRLAVDDVADDLVASYLDLDGDPLIAVVGLRL